MTPLLLNFLKVVARHGRLDCLREIRAAAQQQYNDHAGPRGGDGQDGHAVERTAADADRTAAGGGLGTSKWICSARSHPELLGGLLVRVGDTVFDGSLDNRWTRCRFEMANRTTQLIRDSLQRFLITD